MAGIAEMVNTIARSAAQTWELGSGESCDAGDACKCAQYHSCVVHDSDNDSDCNSDDQIPDASLWDGTMEELYDSTFVSDSHIDQFSSVKESCVCGHCCWCELRTDLQEMSLKIVQKLINFQRNLLVFEISSRLSYQRMLNLILEVAVVRNNAALVELALSNGAKPEDNPLPLFAVENNNIVVLRQLAHCKIGMRRALLVAIRGDNVEAAKILIEVRPRIVTDFNYQSVIYAIKCKRVNLLGLMVPFIQAKKINHLQLLFLAVTIGHIDIVKMLLKITGVIPNNFCLARAASDEFYHGVKALLDAGADPTANGREAINFATKKGYKKIIELLLVAEGEAAKDQN